MDIQGEYAKAGCRLLLFAAALGVMAAFTMLSGCGVERTDGNKVKELEYVIVEDEDIPEELKNRIEEKKAADFKLVYESDSDLYVVRGYGEQETGGYSIQILDFYLTKNAVVFQTNLMGPTRDEIKNTAPSYPYIVLKTENPGKNVIFK